MKRILASTLTLLSVFLGVNHFIGLIRSHGLYLHVAGVIANTLAIAAGFLLQRTC